MKKYYEELFPFLSGTEWRITSPQNPNYNCIAWAANDVNRFWWPDEDYDAYWPSNIPREETIDAFVQAYGTLGYKKCDSFHHEKGYEKIAIYIGKDGKPKHAARQLDNKKWSSKLGREHDIEHELISLNNAPNYNSVYGEPKIFMRRSIDIKK